MRWSKILDTGVQHYYAWHMQSLPSHGLRTVNSIPWSIPKCWLVLKGRSELRSSHITCFLTHGQPFSPCSHPDHRLTTVISIDGQLSTLYGWSTQLPWVAALSFFYRDLLPTTLPLLQRAPRHSSVQEEKERHRQKEGLPKVTQTGSIRQKLRRSPVSWPTLQSLAQASVKNTLYSTLQIQSSCTFLFKSRKRNT